MQRNGLLCSARALVPPPPIAVKGPAHVYKLHNLPATCMHIGFSVHSTMHLGLIDLLKKVSVAR